MRFAVFFLASSLCACGFYRGPSSAEELARVHQRAKFDLKCDEPELVVLDSYKETGIPRTVGVKGCKQQATYLCVAGASGCTWTMDSAEK